jgi:hypothetical protein
LEAPHHDGDPDQIALAIPHLELPLVAVQGNASEETRLALSKVDGQHVLVYRAENRPQVAGAPALAGPR